MKCVIDYDIEREMVVVSTDSIEDVLWDSFLRTMAYYSTTVQQRGDRAFISLRTFLSLRTTIAQFFKNHYGEATLTLQPGIVNRIERINSKSYNTATQSNSISEYELKSGLAKAGFVRKLTPNQICKIRKLDEQSLLLKF